MENFEIMRNSKTQSQEMQGNTRKHKYVKGNTRNSKEIGGTTRERKEIFKKEMKGNICNKYKL